MPPYVRFGVSTRSLSPMKKLLFAPLALALFAAPVLNAAEVGKPAPDFTLTGGDGKTYKLSDVKGKVVVLEWTNPACPFVVKFYEKGDMQKYQKEAADKEVVWYRVNSGAPGIEGTQTAEEITAYDKEHNVAAAASLLDPEGTTGKAYAAKTTPHMYIIDKEGVLVYNGGIDSKKSTDQADIATATPYFKAALDEVLEGKPVSNATTQPYGCGVKYKK